MLKIFNRRTFWKAAYYAHVLEEIYQNETYRDKTIESYKKNLGADPKSNLEEDKVIIELAVLNSIDRMWDKHNIPRPDNSQLMEYLNDVKPLAAEKRKQTGNYLLKTQDKGLFRKISTLIKIIPEVIRVTEQSRKIKKRILEKLLQNNSVKETAITPLNIFL